MKKKIIKLFSTILIGCSLLSTTANAYMYKIEDINTIACSDSLNVYADNSQWAYKYSSLEGKYVWMCARPDFHQIYVNAWICTDGKWYYVDINGTMLSNKLIRSNGTLYYVGEDGAMIVSANITVGYKTYHINSNGECQLI